MAQMFADEDKYAELVVNAIETQHVKEG